MLYACEHVMCNTLTRCTHSKIMQYNTIKNNINTIYLDYFGGGAPKYYLGDKYRGWWSSFGPPPSGSYFAVSLNSLMGNQARPIGDIKIKPEDTYSWLKNKTPVARGGSSILIYKID